MSVLARLAEVLGDPRLEGVDYNSSGLLIIHRQILLEKKMLREVFAEFYTECISADTRYLRGEGRRVEVGAGVSFFREILPEIISTDIKEDEHLDIVVDALNLPFADCTMRSIYGINCFHHFPDPEKFFAEVQRVLADGGGCILIEPYYGPLASGFFRHLFVTERFDKEQIEWKNEESRVMSGANQALSYIVLFRDRKRFRTLFPELEIVYSHPLNNYLRYLLSGGLNFKSILPAFMSPIARILEKLCLPFDRILALHHIMVIRKKLD